MRMAHKLGAPCRLAPVEADGQLVPDGPGKGIYCNDGDIAALGGERVLISTHILHPGAYFLAGLPWSEQCLNAILLRDSLS